MQVWQLQRHRNLIDERGLLCNCIDAINRHLRAANGDDDARQARARADIEQAKNRPGRLELVRTVVVIRHRCEFAAQRRYHGQAVQQVVRHHVVRVAHCGQVIDLVPFLDQVEVGQELTKLRWEQTYAHRRGAFGQARREQVSDSRHGVQADTGSANWMKPRFFRCTSSSEMDAGVMPEMREASPNVSGLRFARVCRASKLSAVTCK